MDNENTVPTARRRGPGLYAFMESPVMYRSALHLPDPIEPGGDGWVTLEIDRPITIANIERVVNRFWTTPPEFYRPRTPVEMFSEQYTNYITHSCRIKNNEISINELNNM